MKLSSNTYGLANRFGFQKAVDMLADAGFDAIDYSAFNEEFYTDAHDKNFYLEARKRAEDRGLYFNQAHAPFPSSHGDPIKDDEAFRHITHSMKIAGWLGVQNIIVHPCQHLVYAERKNPEKLFEMNMAFYRRLIPYCEEYGVHVAVENLWQYIRNNVISRSTCSTPEEFLRYLDGLNSPHFVACLDTGHALLTKEKPDDMVRAIGSKYLKCLHVHDVDGLRDTHTMPYYGIIEWENFMQSLAEIGYTGELTLEADIFLSNAPDILCPDALKYMAAIGKNLISIFDKYAAR